MSDIRQQSGVVPYLIQALPHLHLQEVQFILVTGRRNAWIFPKGGLEDHLTPRESAEKEGKEEGGIIGIAHAAPCGKYEYEKQNQRYSVSMYLMHVTQLLTPWDEMDWRQRRIFPFGQALNAIDERQKQILVTAYRQLQCQASFS